MLNQLSAYLAYIGPALVIALKVGIVIGAIGSALESVGLWLKLPRLVAFGKTLEAIGGDVPKVIKNVWAMLPGFIQKLIPFTPPAVLFLLVCFGSGVATGCALFSPADYAHCLPSTQNLLADVANILRKPDYAKQLEELGLAKGEAVVTCAVKQFVDSLSGKIGVSPGDAEAVARGKAFLASKAAK